MRACRMDKDFSRLYALLGLQPDCTLEAFKHSYRRRVAELHPDRQPQNATDSDPDMSLSELTVLYDQALQFHKRHGRLPGAPPANRTSSAKAAHLSARQTTMGDGTEARGRYRSNGLLLAVLLAVGAYLVFDSMPEKQPTPTTSLPSEPVPAEPDPMPRQLEIGMDMDAVMTLQGRPTHMREKVWEYGPSWIRFEDGRAVEWYSSPLYRLRTPLSTAASITPPAE